MSLQNAGAGLFPIKMACIKILLFLSEVKGK
jgi:hypothetical protein